MAALFRLLALHGAAAATESGSGAPTETGWIDRDTPEEAWYSKSTYDGEWLQLVFSDEFEMEVCQGIASPLLCPGDAAITHRPCASI